MSDPNEPQMTEEQMRQLQAELERITVEDVIHQTIVSLINLGALKGGLTTAPGEGPPPDWPQTKLAIDGVRALLPLLEVEHAEALAPVRDALSQLQLAFAQNSGVGAGAEAPPEQAPPKPEAPGGGRLWVPGQ